MDPFSNDNNLAANKWVEKPWSFWAHPLLLWWDWNHMCVFWLFKSTNSFCICCQKRLDQACERLDFDMNAAECPKVDVDGYSRNFIHFYWLVEKPLFSMKGNWVFKISLPCSVINYARCEKIQSYRKGIEPCTEWF